MRSLRLATIALFFAALVLVGMGFYAAYQQTAIATNLSDQRAIAQQIINTQTNKSLTPQQNKVLEDALSQLPEAASINITADNALQAEAQAQKLLDSLTALALNSDQGSERAFAAKTARDWLSASNQAGLLILPEASSQALESSPIGTCEPLETAGDEIALDDTLDALAQSLHALKYYSQVTVARAEIDSLSEVETSLLTQTTEYTSYALETLEAEAGCYAQVFSPKPHYILAESDTSSSVLAHYTTIDQNIYALLEDPSAPADLRAVALFALLNH